VVRKSVSILLQVRTQLNRVSCGKLSGATAVRLVQGSSCPMAPHLLVLLVLEQDKIESLFEVGRIIEVSQWCDRDSRWDLLLHFSSSVCKFGTLS